MSRIQKRLLQEVRPESIGTMAPEGLLGLASQRLSLVPPSKRGPSRQRLILLAALISIPLGGIAIQKWRRPSQSSPNGGAAGGSLLSGSSSPTAVQLTENLEAIKTFHEGNYEGALNSFTRLAIANPESAVLRSNLALANARSGKTTEAVRFYKEATQLDPKNAIILNNLAALSMEQGARDEAISILESSIQLKPDFAEPLLNLGKAFELGASWEKAQRTYDRYLQHSAGDPLIKKLLKKRMAKLQSLAHIAALDADTQKKTDDDQEEDTR